MTLDTFWKIYFSDKARFSFEDFYTHRKQRNFHVTKWQPIEGEETKQETCQRLKRSFNMTVNITGVPFCSSSRCLRESTAIMADKEIVIESSVSTPDVPYGNYFFVKDRWVIGSTSSQGNQVFLKVFMHLDFVKHTYF